jgi:putative ABC transport system permease protein
MIAEYFTIAIKSMKKRKLRSFLTLVGIIISISVIFMLISISLGLDAAIKEQFKALGTDKLFILPKGQLGAPGSGGAVMLTKDDVSVIEKVSGVKKVSYFLAQSVKVSYQDQNRYVYAIGLEKEGIGLFMESGLQKIDEGKAIKSGDQFKVNIGSAYKYDNVFKNPIKTGNKININDVPFTVKGIMQSVGNPQDDKQIYLVEEDFRNLFNVSERVDQIIVQADSGVAIGDLATKIEKKLISSRGVTKKTEDFSIQTPEELLASFTIILNILTGFLIGVAAISLFVGGIGIMNTMYTSVLERIKEIGVMKAIGARNSNILLIFTIESGVIGLIGGAVGILVGYGIAKFIEYIALVQLKTSYLQAATPWYLILGSLVFSFLVGAVSGLWPSWRASRIKPVDALRYE